MLSWSPSTIKRVDAIPNAKPNPINIPQSLNLFIE